MVIGNPRSCLVDTCSFDMLTEQIPVRCNMASAYVKTCELVKGNNNNWRKMKFIDL